MKPYFRLIMAYHFQTSEYDITLSGQPANFLHIAVSLCMFLFLFFILFSWLSLQECLSMVSFYLIVGATLNIQQGSSDIDQLGKIFAAFGTATPSQWPDLAYLPDYVEYQYVAAPPLRSLFPTASDDALDLLSKMFTYDPKARITAQQALEHRFAKSFNGVFVFVDFFSYLYSANQVLLFCTTAYGAKQASQTSN